jgi:5'-deoxynucleotidase YfbR-like HD superfamily hydrolase
MSIELQTTAEFLRASHITRWGIVQTATRQSIAEHMWRVWQLTVHWGPLAGLNPMEQADAEQLALTHDLAEIRTGDAPTPHKTAELKVHLDQIEAQIVPEVVAHEKACSDRTRALVKFCDTAEAILFLRVNGLGAHAASVQDLLEHQMRDRLTTAPFADDQKHALIVAFISTKNNT